MQEGRSGIGPITQFDATAFNCRIAGEVKNFDPTRWIEKKEIKKMGALHPVRHRGGGVRHEGSGLKVTPRMPSRSAFTSAAASADSK